MTATAASPDELQLVALVDGQRDQVADGGPYGEGQDEVDEQGDVVLSAVPVRRQLHEATLVSVLVVVQLIWLTTLGYELLRLLS